MTFPYIDRHKSRSIGAALGIYAVLWAASPAFPETHYAVTLTITSELPYPNTPMDPRLDLGQLARNAGSAGQIDPNSIQVIDAATGMETPCAVSEDFTYGDAGRIEWVAADPSHRSYEIRFALGETRPALQPALYVPMIGTGDLLRYNAGVPRPVALSYPAGWYDLNGDGKRDLAGCWNYAYRPGWPWDGVIMYPALNSSDPFTVGDLARIRYQNAGPDNAAHDFTGWYMQSGFGDFDHDGRIDLVFSPRTGSVLSLYHNEVFLPAGLPRFVACGEVNRPENAWGPVQAVDLDGDGALDITLGAIYSDAPARTFWLRNANPNGWPFQPEAGVDLHVAEGACFFDVDGDARLDAVGLEPTPDKGLSCYRVVWQLNEGGVPPVFSEAQSLEGVAPEWVSAITAIADGPERGLIVQTNVFQEVTFYPWTGPVSPYFGAPHRFESVAAVMSLSDQAWPYACDWDSDGDWDLLIGGGYGWPRIVRNTGTTQRPAFAEPELILSEGKPIRFLRNALLGEPFHTHNMGYPYPAFVDWDGDGLSDLVCPNETNRIYWYKNTGSKTMPAFGPRQLLIVDGYAESPEAMKRSAERALDATYPLEPEQPFFWRTGAGFADWTGDGLMDLITLDGASRQLTLFAQYRAEDGVLHLRSAGPFLMADGRKIDDAIVGRAAHWTESFKCIDWDRDGALDIVYSCAGTEPEKGSIYLLRNTGSTQAPRFDAPRTFCCYGEPIKVTAHGPHAWAGDLNGDALPDLLACTEWSVYPFYAYAALEMPARPAYTLSNVQPRPAR